MNKQERGPFPPADPKKDAVQIEALIEETKKAKGKEAEREAKNRAALEALIEASREGDEEKAKEVLNLMGIEISEGASAEEVQTEAFARSLRDEAKPRIRSWSDVKDIVAGIKKGIVEVEAFMVTHPEIEPEVNERLEDLLAETESKAGGFPGRYQNIIEIYIELIARGYKDVRSVVEAIEKKDLEIALMLKIILSAGEKEGFGLPTPILKAIIESHD